MTTPVPVIDLGATGAADAIADAYRRWGFAQLVGHGLGQQLERAAEAGAAFHELDEADKLRLALDRNHRGYIAAETSTDRASELAAAERPNASSSFMLMRDAGPADPAVLAGHYLAGPNRWPDLPDFRAVMEQTMAELTALARRLLPMVAGPQVARHVAPAFDEPTLWFRLIRYPGTEIRGAVEQFGSAPHVDFGALTLLSQDSVGGLEVLSPSGDWIGVPPIDGALVMNTGEMLHRWSNGEILATPHRVLSPQGRQRDSMAFFFDPSMDATVAPVTTDAAPRFEPVRFDDYVRNQLEASYDAHQVDLGP